MSAGLQENLRALIDGYDAVALIANSESLNLETVLETVPDRTLFVFFTRCSRILKEPFGRDSVLCHRLKSSGAFNEGKSVVQMGRTRFAPGALKGEIGLIVGKGGTAGPASAAQAGEDVDFLLNLDAHILPWYTARKAPSSGFAMAVWLSETLPDKTIHLCGFTGVRGTDFRMRDVHDWTLEQAVLRLLYKRGRLVRIGHGDPERSVAATLKARFPEAGDTEIATVLSEIADERLNAQDHLLSRSWTMLTLPRRIRSFFKTGKLRAG